MRQKNTNEVRKDIDLSKVDSLIDINHENIERDILSAVMETPKLDKVFSGPSTSVQQEREEMEYTASNVSSERNSISFGSENGVRWTSEEHNQSTSLAIADDSRTITPDDNNQPTSSVSLGDSKKKTKDIAESSDNQLVPEGIDKPGDDKEDIAGEDQVVDENDNKICKTSEEDEEKMIAKQISDGVLTDSMLDQEKKLHQEHLEEEKEMVTKAMEEWETTVEKQRYSRLQHLLQKSNVYSSFLLQRIEEQKAENEKRKAREAKKAEKAKKEDNQESPQTVPDTKRGRKSKKKSTGYNITDYVDSEALKKSSKESIAATFVPDKDDKNLSIGHHSQEKNASQNDTGEYKKPQLLIGGSLRDYQIEGLEWLKVLFENGVNGILADEMGLGKTIQCISLIAHLIENKVRGPFLVTAPLSTLPNWLAEFKRFTPGICAMIYHGTPDERAELRKKFGKLYGENPLKSFPVAITSYDIIMRDRRHLMKYKWKYLIVDEGHRIKNLKCKLISELKAFPAANRLLLTGTPLQNNLSELWSLLNFLLPDIFNDLNSFQAWFDFSAISESDGSEKIIAQEREHHVLERLHAILTPFLLRRLKSDVSLDVPPKKEVFVYAPLTQKQKHWYQLLLDKTRLFSELKGKKELVAPSFTPTGRVRRRCSHALNYSIFDDNKMSHEDVMKELVEEDARKKEAQQTVSTPETCERNVKVNSILTQLRKACMHPYLLEYPLDVETQDYRIDEEVITSSGKTLILDQMLPVLKKRGHKILLFSQMTKLLDILEDFCYLRKYKYSRIDGSTSFEDRQEQIDDFNSDPDIFIFLLSTRAGGLGLNLTAADTVIIYDSDWNPQQDLQAQDRCHRIGQTKPVVVYRLITANTVDQRVVEVAYEKRRLEKMIIHKEKFKGRLNEKHLTAKELMELLESTDHMAAINSDDITSNQVLSSEQLNKLLDRSDMLPGCENVAIKSSEDNQVFKIVNT